MPVFGARELAHRVTGLRGTADQCHPALTRPRADPDDIALFSFRSRAVTNAPLVDQPIPCAKCGFDLRGTPIGGFCPECGLKVVTTQAMMKPEGYWVDGNRLVVRTGAVLPPRCVKTNEPVHEPQVTKTLQWCTPLVYLTILINVVVLLIVYFIVRKQCQITYSIGAAARARKTRNVLISTAVFVGSVLLCIFLFANDWIGVGLLFVVIAFAGLIAIAFSARDLAAIKHKDGQFWIKGCGPEFLASLASDHSAP
jgi:hypothetical protein